jgi:hypothetical protein
MEVASFMDHLHYIRHCHRYIVKLRLLVATMHLQTDLLKLVVVCSSERCTVSFSWAVKMLLTIDGALWYRLCKSLRTNVLNKNKIINPVMLAYMGRNPLMITFGSCSP